MRLPKNRISGEAMARRLPARAGTWAARLNVLALAIVFEVSTASCLMTEVSTHAIAGMPLPPPVKAAAKAPAPVSPTLTLPGLRARVSVRRDARGIPYVEAANEHDLFLTQGFVTANDRLWQMDLLRRTARGELAEILGRDVLEQDEQMRVLGFGRLANGLVERVPSRMREALIAYAQGVNASMTARTDAGLPAEFGILGYKPKPWVPADSLVIGKLFALDLSATWPADVVRASFAELPADRQAALFPKNLLSTWCWSAAMHRRRAMGGRRAVPDRWATRARRAC